MESDNLNDALVNILEASSTIDRVVRRIADNKEHLTKTEREAIQILKVVLESLDNNAHSVKHVMSLLARR